MSWQESEVWAVLGIAETGDERAVKRAYAKQLKQTRPEDDPQGFQQLRTAYERALVLARYVREQEQEREPEESAAEEDKPEPSSILSAPETKSETKSENSLSESEIIAAAVLILEAAPAPASPPITTLEPEAAPDQETPLVAASEAEQTLDAAKTTLHLKPRPQVQELHCLPREEIELSATPFEIANQLWQEFVGQHDVLQSASLARLLSSQALLNLEVRDAFEFYCAQYCADEHADSAMRKTIVEFFNWQVSFAHLLKMHPVIPHVAMDRYFADAGYQHLAALAAQGNRSLKMLMADSVPKFMLAIYDRRFINEMRETLHQLQWRYPEVLRHKLNENVVEVWREVVNRKRYYRQTLATSAIFGFVAFFLLQLTFDALSLIDDEYRLVVSFVLGETLSIAGFAWFSFHPPERLHKWVNMLRDQLLYKPIHVYRYELRFQLIYLPWLFFAPFCLLDDQLNGLPQVLTFIFSSIACVLSIYAASLYLTWAHYAIALLMAFLGTIAFDKLSMGQVHPLTATILGYAYAILLLRTGPGALSRLRIPHKAMLQARLAWLALLLATLALVVLPVEYFGFPDVSNQADFLGASLLIVFSPGFLLMSILISQQTIFNVIFNIALFRFINSFLWPDVIEKLALNPRMKMLILVMCVQGIYVLANILTSFYEYRSSRSSK